MTFANTLNAIVWFILIGALLFWPAGTFDWPEAWVFLAEFFGGSLFMVVWLARRDPGLLRQRMGGAFQKGQVFWDKIFMAVMMLVWYGWLVLMVLDAKRWAWSHMPLWLEGIGGILIPLGFGAVFYTFRENSYAAPVIRIQEERGQRVIDTGPYAIVRHPMYSGAILYMLGMPLLLGSWIGLAVLPLIIAFLIVRIFLEERTLRRGLSGYGEYASRVRWRLIPGLW